MTLTRRQYDIVWRIATGESKAKVARALGISESGVQRHIEAIGRKLPGAGSPRTRIISAARRLLENAP